MARTIQLACARCGHTQMHEVESAESNEQAELADASNDGKPNSEALRLQRLKSLPTSLPVGGIITPV
jgi:hypothetical protein